MLGSFRAFLVIAPLALTPVLYTMTAPAFAHERDDGDEGISRSELRELLMDRLQRRQERRDELLGLLEERSERRSELMDLLQERGERRGKLLDLLADREREGRPGRLRRMMSESEERGECLFLTRSLRDADGDFLILVRRRICPDND